MKYTLYAVRIFAADWSATVAFYRDVIGLVEKFSDEAAGWAEFDVGGPSLAVERPAPDDAEGAALVGRFLGVSLSVADIATTYESLAAKGVEFLGPPEQQPWGGVLAHFKDPDGNIVTLLGSPEAP
jgi:lactoylglutathione lyase